jgi:DNA polymerase III subunit delta'
MLSKEHVPSAGLMPNTLTSSSPGGGCWPRVVGQHRVKQTLLAALRTNRLAHAYLFHGPEGVGKDAMAIELARVMHCEQGGEEACGVCPSCRKAASLQHPDIHLVTALPVGRSEDAEDGPLDKLPASDMGEIRDEIAAKASDPYHRMIIPRATIIKINSIREVRRVASMSTYDSHRRVFIISQADSMGDAAANTLLKTLEEPSGDTMFILTTAHRDALPETILSRCQQVRFDVLAEQEIAEALAQRQGIDQQQASLIARLAHGSYARAIDLLQTDLNTERDAVVAFLLDVVMGKNDSVADAVDELAQTKDRERVARFLTLMLLWFRDALVLQHGADVINVDQEPRIQKFINKYPNSDLHQILADIERALSLLDRNIYIKLVLLDLAVRLHSNIREV